MPKQAEQGKNHSALTEWRTKSKLNNQSSVVPSPPATSTTRYSAMVPLLPAPAREAMPTAAPTSSPSSSVTRCRTDSLATGRQATAASASSSPGRRGRVRASPWSSKLSILAGSVQAISTFTRLVAVLEITMPALRSMARHHRDGKKWLNRLIKKSTIRKNGWPIL